MKNKIIGYLLIFLMMFNSSQAFAFDTEAQFKDYLRNNYYPLKIRVAGKFQYANFNTYKRYNLICYGEPRGDYKYNKATGRNEFRFLGYTQSGTDYTNTLFPKDLGGENKPENFEYIDVKGADDSWITIEENVKSFMMNSRLTGNGVVQSNFNVKFINKDNALNKTKVLSSPSWNNGYSIFTKNLKSWGGVYYATFNGMNLSGNFKYGMGSGSDTDISGAIITDKEIYRISAGEDEVDVKISVEANAILRGSAKQQQIKKITAAYKESSASASGRANVEVNKTIKFNRTNLKIGENTIDLFGNVGLKSIFNDQYNKNIYKPIKIIVDEKKDAYVTLDASINPTSKKFEGSNMSFEIKTHVELVNKSIKNLIHWEIFCNGVKEVIDTKSAVIEHKRIMNMSAAEYNNNNINKEYKKEYTIRAVPIFSEPSSLEADGTVQTLIYEEEIVIPPVPPTPPPIANLPPTVEIISVDVVEQGQAIVLSSNAVDSDGTIEHYYWGTDGLITASPLDTIDNAFVFGKYDSIGRKRISVIVVDNDGASAFAIKEIEVVPIKPSAALKTSGAFKENRKVTLDISDSKGDPDSDIDWSRSMIQIYKDGIITNKIAYNGSLNAVKIKDLLFKEAGIYNIKVSVYNTLGYADIIEKNIAIEPDEEPVADFEVINTVLRNPNEGNIATVNITNKSYSLDNDIIARLKISKIYDSNNNGTFSDDAEEIVYDGINIDKKEIKFSEVGKYRIKAYVTEEFGQETIRTLITASDLKSDNTDDKGLLESVVKVDNVAPFVDFTPQKKEKLNLLFLTDNKVDKNIFESKLNSSLKQELLKVGYDVNTIVKNGYDEALVYLVKIYDGKYKIYKHQDGVSKYIEEVPTANINVGKNDIAYYYDENKKSYMGLNLHTLDRFRVNGIDIDPKGQYFYGGDEKGIYRIKNIPNIPNKEYIKLNSVDDENKIMSVGHKGLIYQYYTSGMSTNKFLLNLETLNQVELNGWNIRYIDKKDFWYMNEELIQTHHLNKYDINSLNYIDLESKIEHPYANGFVQKEILNNYDNENEFFIKFGSASTNLLAPYQRGIYRYKIIENEIEYLIDDTYSLVEFKQNKLYLRKGNKIFTYDIKTRIITETDIPYQNVTVIKGGYKSLMKPSVLIPRLDNTRNIIIVDNDLYFREDKKEFIDMIKRNNAELVLLTNDQEQFLKLRKELPAKMINEDSFEAQMSSLETYILEKKDVRINILNKNIDDVDLMKLNEENILAHTNKIEEPYEQSDEMIFKTHTEFYWREDDYIKSINLETGTERFIDLIKRGTSVIESDGEIFYNGNYEYIKSYNPKTKKKTNYNVKGELIAAIDKNSFYYIPQYKREVWLFRNNGTVHKNIITLRYGGYYDAREKYYRGNTFSNGDLRFITDYTDDYDTHGTYYHYRYRLEEDSLEEIKRESAYLKSYRGFYPTSDEKILIEYNTITNQVDGIGNVLMSGMYPLDNKLYFYCSEGSFSRYLGLYVRELDGTIKNLMGYEKDMSLIYGYNDRLVFRDKNKKIWIYDLLKNELIESDINHEYSSYQQYVFNSSNKIDYDSSKVLSYSLSDKKLNYLIDTSSNNYTEEQLLNRDLKLLTNGDITETIKSELEGKKDSKVYVLLNQKIDYTSFYFDYESDPILSEEWIITQTNKNYFENSNGYYPQSGHAQSEKVETFSYKGEYEISLKVKDNPKQDSRFSNYNKLSNIATAKIYVHEKPVANFNVTLEKGAATYYDTSYDRDAGSKINKGIVERQYRYKESKENIWYDGKLKEPKGNTEYIFELRVKDEQGAWSNPKRITKSSENLPNPVFELQGNVTPRITTKNGVLRVEADIVSNANITYCYGYLEDYYYKINRQYQEKKQNLDILKQLGNKFELETEYEMYSEYYNGRYIKPEYIFVIEAMNEFGVIKEVRIPITIGNNNPPMADIINISENKKGGDIGTFDVKVTDLDNDSMNLNVYIRHIEDSSYTLLESRNNLSNSIQSYSTNPLRKGQYLIKAVVSDGKNSTEDSDKMDVLNSPPSVMIGTVPTVFVGENITFNVGINDPDMDKMKLDIYIKNNTDSFSLLERKSNINTGWYTYTIPNAKSGSYTIRAVVTDYSLSASTEKITNILTLKIIGEVHHTAKWNENRQQYNLAKSGNNEVPRGYDVFFAGEKFILKAVTEGKVSSVTVNLEGTVYSSNLYLNGSVWYGSIWNKEMINWNDRSCTFKFTARTNGGQIKVHYITVQIKNDEYWKYHREF